jgi:hypothetical protein
MKPLLEMNRGRRKEEAVLGGDLASDRKLHRAIREFQEKK